MLIEAKSNETERDSMGVRLNTDVELVKVIKEGLKKKDGYCPCRMERTEENKCICKEFRAQIVDPDFEGYCHCMLYYKYKDTIGKDEEDGSDQGNE